jgi:hypothetical protein
VIAFCTDEHVPSVFITTLRSNGYNVVRATDVFGQGTDDRRLLEYCSEQDRILITHDKKDFSSTVGEAVTHAGIVIYTDPIFLRRDPETAVRTLDRIFDYYPQDELVDERIWLDQWRV